METLLILVPISLAGVAVIVALLWWAIDSGQYDDLKGPAESILCDEDVPVTDEPEPAKGEAPPPFRSGLSVH